MRFFRRKAEQPPVREVPSAKPESEPRLKHMTCILPEETLTAVEKVKGGIEILRKTPLDNASREVIQKAEADLVHVLEKMGFHTAAQRVLGLSDDEAFFLFDGVMLKSAFGEGAQPDLAGFLAQNLEVSVSTKM